MMLNHGLRRKPSACDGSIASLTTSQTGTSAPKCIITVRMWSCIRWISSVRFSGVGVIGLPLASLNTQAGVCACQTRVWPRTCMLLALANATCASAAAKVKLPALGCSASHFMSFSDVTLLKCLVSRTADSPVRSAARTAAPTGN